MHGCILSMVATDVLVLKHQAISIHNADLILYVLGRFYIKKNTFTVKNPGIWNYILKEIIWLFKG